jgi:hypothetical protein
MLRAGGRLRPVIPLRGPRDMFEGRAVALASLVVPLGGRSRSWLRWKFVPEDVQLLAIGRYRRIARWCLVGKRGRGNRPSSW